MKIELQHVHYMPKELKPGVLYVSEEFGTAAHLCPCGCNTKIRTPLGPTEWKLEETNNVPTLWPSIGNWQLPCQSHYWIEMGQIVWAPKWTSEQIVAGRRMEEEKRRVYYDRLNRRPDRVFRRFLYWLQGLLKR
jgi:hypothetical protein